MLGERVRHVQIGVVRTSRAHGVGARAPGRGARRGLPRRTRGVHEPACRPAHAVRGARRRRRAHAARGRPSPDPVPTSLELYLVRHAVAAERGPDYPDDAQRPLTPEGAARWRRSVAGLRELGVVSTSVLASPLVRAHETAEILAAGLKPKPRLVTSEALAPGRKPCGGAGRDRQDTPRRRAAPRGSRWSATSPTSASWRRGCSAPRAPSSSRRARCAASTSTGRCRRSRRAALAAAAARAAGPGSVKPALVVINPISGAGRGDAGGCR